MDRIQNLINAATSKVANEKQQRYEYWQNWLVTQKAKLDEQEEIDPLQKSLYQLMELAISLKQYERPDDENEEVSRVIRFSIDLPNELVESLFKVKVYTLYGTGSFTVMDGLLLTRETKERMGYPTSGPFKYYDTHMFTEEQRKTYNFSLPTPAMGGLFIPKRTRLLEWITRNKQLQYFDIVNKI